MTNDTRNKLAALIGVVILVGLFLSAWIPQPCPVLRKALIGCPNTTAPRYLSLTDQEIARVPHQDITEDRIVFSVKSQDYRAETQLTMDYRDPTSQYIGVLQLKTNNGFRPVALVTHPALANLHWTRVSNSSLSLYTRNGGVDSIDQFLQNLPPVSQLLVDPAAALQANLKPNQYTPLPASAIIPDSANFILTSYLPPNSDGLWKVFQYTTDASDAAVPDQKLQWIIDLTWTGSGARQPFQAGTVHVDYQSMHP